MVSSGDVGGWCKVVWGGDGTHTTWWYLIAGDAPMQCIVHSVHSVHSAQCMVHSA